MKGKKILHVLLEFLLQIKMFPKNDCFFWSIGRLFLQRKGIQRRGGRGEKRTEVQWEGCIWSKEDYSADKVLPKLQEASKRPSSEACCPQSRSCAMEKAILWTVVPQVGCPQCLCGHHVVLLCYRDRLHVGPGAAAGEPCEELSTQYLVSNAVQTAGMQAPSWEIPITLLN